MFGKKMEKLQLCLFFVAFFHILVNWRNVINLVKHTVVILNVHANDLLKYLAFKWPHTGKQRRRTGNAPVLGGTFERWWGLRK